MNTRQEFLADYLYQLVQDKGTEAFYAKGGDYIQILVCMYVVEDLYEMMGKGKSQAQENKI